jgi:hypothetical protein
MGMLQIDVAFPVAVLAVGAACLVALRTLEHAALRLARRRTLDALASVPTSSSRGGRGGSGRGGSGRSLAAPPSRDSV